MCKSLHIVFSAISVLVYIPLIQRDPGQYQNTTDEMYSVVGERADSGGVGENEYETPQALSGSTYSQPATAAPGDYERV